MRKWMWCLALAACAPDSEGGTGPWDATSEDRSAGDVAGDEGTDPGADPGTDGTSDRAADDGADLPSDGSAEADAESDAPPAHPVCRYECENDGECTTVYGAGWGCRGLSSPTGPMCMRLCGSDAECRSGGASDPLMFCSGEVCAMRACAGAEECTWVHASAVCQELEFGTIRTCQRLCGIDSDCYVGAPTDTLYRCRSGVCLWTCDTDGQCASAFGSADYGCRTPVSIPGASCFHACDVREDCLYGASTDLLVDCR